MHISLYFSLYTISFLAKPSLINFNNPNKSEWTIFGSLPREYTAFVHTLTSMITLYFPSQEYHGAIYGYIWLNQLWSVYFHWWDYVKESWICGSYRTENKSRQWGRQQKKRFHNYFLGFVPFECNHLRPKMYPTNF